MYQYTSLDSLGIAIEVSCTKFRYMSHSKFLVIIVSFHFHRRFGNVVVVVAAIRLPRDLRLGRLISSDAKFCCLKPVHTPQCHHRELPNQVFHLEGDTGNRKLVCDWPFASLLRICSSPRAPSPICALLSGTVQRQYVGGLV